MTVEKHPDMEPFEVQKPRAPCKDFIFTLILLVHFFDSEILSPPPRQQCSGIVCANTKIFCLTPCSFVACFTTNTCLQIQVQQKNLNIVFQSFSNMTFHGTTLIAINEIASYEKVYKICFLAFCCVIFDKKNMFFYQLVNLDFLQCAMCPGLFCGPQVKSKHFLGCHRKIGENRAVFSSQLLSRVLQEQFCRGNLSYCSTYHHSLILYNVMQIDFIK